MHDVSAKIHQTKSHQQHRKQQYYSRARMKLKWMYSVRSAPSSHKCLLQIKRHVSIRVRARASFTCYTFNVIIISTRRDLSPRSLFCQCFAGATNECITCLSYEIKKKEGKIFSRMPWKMIKTKFGVILLHDILYSNSTTETTYVSY